MHSAVQCSSAEGNAVQYSVVKFKALQYSVLKFSAACTSSMHCTQVQCRVHKFSKIYTSIVKCSQVQCSVHTSSVQFITSHDESVGNGEAEVAVDVVKAAGHGVPTHPISITTPNLVNIILPLHLQKHLFKKNKTVYLHMN